MGLGAAWGFLCVAGMYECHLMAPEINSDGSRAEPIKITGGLERVIGRVQILGIVPAMIGLFAAVLTSIYWEMAKLFPGLQEWTPIPDISTKRDILLSTFVIVLVLFSTNFLLYLRYRKHIKNAWETSKVESDKIRGFRRMKNRLRQLKNK